MSRGWQFHVPYRSRDETPREALTGNAVAAIADPEERRVAAQILLDSVADPNVRTVGDLLDRVEAATPDQRRAMLDGARRRAGLATTGRIEAMEAFEAASSRSSAGARSEYPICAAPECRSFPVNDIGAHARTNVRRWWCAAHKHLAEPGDMEPRTSGVRYSSSGALEFADEVEAEGQRARVEAESRRRQREVREAQRREEGERLAELEAARDERQRREHVGWRP
jgi:hypothetical protein